MFRPNANNQWKYKAVKNLKKGDYVRFPKHIQTDFTINDSEYAWLIGLIIGDGHITKNGAIQISVNKDDYYIAEQAKNILDKITQSTTNISKRSLNKGVYTVECSSKIFGNWLRTKIYNDKQKIIPNFIINSSNKIRTCCLQGLFEADGTFKNGDREKRFVHSTISHKLASQISSIFHSLQVKCSINEEKRDTNKKKNSIIYRIVGYGKENVEWCEQLMTIPFEDNIEESELETGYQYEITNVKKYQYEGKVYNCEVENDHSYVVYPGFVAHNCCNFQGWQRITQDLPVKVLGDTPGLSEPAPSTQALAEEYRTSRIFLNTSTISPIPTALLEGMASGCACVSTATCMIPEIIENGVNGFISNDESELRKYCEMLLEDDELARKLGENAQKTIRENFSPEQFVEKWNLVFNKVLL